MPARASDDPISLRNPRRDTASSHSDAPLGNSRCIISLNSGLPASSSRLRQNSGPFFFWISAVAAARSSLPFFCNSSFLPGQTSSRCAFRFCFSSLIYLLSSLPVVVCAGPAHSISQSHSPQCPVLKLKAKSRKPLYLWHVL